MLANVNPSNAAQNGAPTQHTPQPSQIPTGLSFNDVLTNELSAAAPPAPTPPAPAVPAASSSSSTTNSNSANQGGSGTSTSGASGTSASGSNGSTSDSTSGSTSGTSPVGGRKGTKPAQSGSQSDTQSGSAAAAAAATAAALASVANAQGQTGNTTGTSATDAAATTLPPTKATATTPTDPTSLTSAVAANAATGQVGAFNAKVPLSDAQGNLAGSATARVNTAIAGQTAIAVNPAQASISKNNAEQSGFEAELNKAASPENVQANKIAATVTTATTEFNPGSVTSSASPSANLLTADSTMQTVKAANQDLSSAQLNAIAPILSVPISDVPAPSTETIAPPVGSSAWDEAVGQKINWMVNENQQSASLTLNPPELGPLQVVLSVSNQHASATFTSHQPEVRAALENAIPKLREMLSQSGIQLGDCNVNSQAKQQFAQSHSQANSGSGNQSGSDRVATVSGASAIASPGQRSGIGLVDTFA